MTNAISHTHIIVEFSYPITLVSNVCIVLQVMDLYSVSMPGGIHYNIMESPYNHDSLLVDCIIHVHVPVQCHVFVRNYVYANSKHED